MGRRQINPGPIKTGPTAQNSRDYAPGISDWICVNPIPNGVMPVNVSTISGDLANAVDGVWYYFDPKGLADVSGHADNWIGVGPNGIEFYADLHKYGSRVKLSSDAETCRVATPLLKPDGTGQFTADDIQGIDFRIEAGENMPHANNEGHGIAVGLAKAEICSIDSSVSIDERKFGVMACYGNDNENDDASARFLGYSMFTASHEQHDNGGSDFESVQVSYNFIREDDDEIITFYASGVPLDSDGEVPVGGLQKKWNSNASWAHDDKIYLFVSLASYENPPVAGESDSTCDYNNDPTITHDNNTYFYPGISVAGTGIPAGATIASKTSNTEFELSASTTGGAVTNGTLTFTDIRRTGAFKVWYRLRYSNVGRVPNWIEGRVNNHSGVNTDRY